MQVPDERSLDREVADLVERLRATELDAEHDAPLEAVAALLAERAPILEAILALDADALSSKARASLKEALEGAQAHDARVTKALVAAQEETADALGRLVDARGAARGYRGGVRSGVGSMRRTA